MGQSTFTRQYIMLRPVDCQASGFARVEVSRGQGRIVIHASGLPERGVRALLVSGRGEGCVLDLGTMAAGAPGCADLQKDHLPLPMLRGYDAVVLCTDWPEGTMLLTGSLSRPPRCTLWQLQEALRHYLRLPCVDLSPVPSQEKAQASCAESVWRLRELRWPEHLQGWQGYFDQYAPCAPFEAPGWRFVRVPMQQGRPSEDGVIGRHVSAHGVDRVAWALPGQADVLPPGGLQGYAWQEGRDGRGYWLRIEHA